MRTFDATTAACTVFTFRQGLLAALGHDLQLTVGRFVIELDAKNAIVARFAADSLRVESAVSDGDRRTIERHAAHDVLDARRFAEIVFRSTKVGRDGDTAQLEGELTLHGVTRAITLAARDDGRQWTAEVTLDQRQFGIEPFSAMLGALRVRADVRVRVTLPSRPASASPLG